MPNSKNKKEEVDEIIPTNHVPPNFKRRQLIFDSFLKLKNRTSDSKETGQRGVVMYSWGAGYHGQLGLNSNLRKKCVLVPQRLEFEEPVIQISCGGFHTACVTENGRVYTWGDGVHGQLGNLHPKHNMLSTPHVVDYLLQSKLVIQQVSCGQYHTACVSKNGLLFTWGSGKYGQHGHGSRLSERYPKKVEIVDPELSAMKGTFAEVSCGDRHTAAVMVFYNKPSKLVTFGSGTHGQLGHGNTDDSNWPKVCKALDDKNIIHVACGTTHTSAVSESGELYLWGFGESIHPKPYSNIVDSPRLVQIKSKIKQVALGQGHVLALSWDGDVYAWGNSQMGQVGHGARGSVRKPRLVLKNKEICEIATGRYHSLAVSTYGILYSWGCGESGQLALGSLESKLFPTIVEAGLTTVIGQISCGEHHSFAISSIPHSSVSSDVKEWLEIEQEELKLKNMMLKEFPNGLQSKHIMDISRNRKRLVESLKEQRARDQEIFDKHLKEQLSSIQTRKSVAREVKESLLMLEHKQLGGNGGSRPLSRPASNQSDKHNEGQLLSQTLGSKSTDQLQVDLSEMDDLNTTQSLSHRLMSSASQPVLSSRRNVRNVQQSQQQGPSTNRNMLVRRTSDAGLRPKGLSELPLRKVRQHDSGMHSNRSVMDDEPTSREHDALVPAGETFYPLAARVQFFERSRVVLERVKSSLQSPAIVNMKPRLMKSVFKLKKENNVLLNKKQRKEAKLNELKREFDLLYLTNDELKEAEGKQARIKELKMKLVTLNTRLMEAEENKRNYELYILRMKEEDVQLSKQIDEMRQSVMELDRAVKKKAKKHQSIVQRKVELDEEIVAFNNDIDEFSIFAGNQLSKYKRLIVSNISNTKKSEEALQSQQNMNKKNRNKKFGQFDVKRAEIDEQEREIKNELTGWQDKVQYYEKRFHKISAATGLTNADDIANKYFFNDDIRHDLEKDINSKKEKIQSLEEKHDNMSEELAKHKGDHVWIKWKDIAISSDKDFDRTKGMKRKSTNLLKWMQKLTYAQEGIVGLLQDIELVVDVPKFDGEPDKLEIVDVKSENSSAVAKTWIDALANRITYLHDKTIERQKIIDEREKERKEQQARQLAQKTSTMMMQKSKSRTPSMIFQNKTAIIEDQKETTSTSVEPTLAPVEKEEESVKVEDDAHVEESEETPITATNVVEDEQVVEETVVNNNDDNTTEKTNENE